MPSGLSSLPPVTAVSAVRPVASVQPTALQPAARPFLAPMLAHPVHTSAALFELASPQSPGRDEPAPTYADPALVNRFGGLAADAATRKAAERPAARRPAARDPEATRRQMRLYAVERLPEDPTHMDLEA